MMQLGKMSALIVSGAFLMVGAVYADPDADSDRHRILAQNSRDCSNNHNCRPSGPKADRHDQDNDRDRDSHIADNRRQDGDRDRDEHRSWGRDRDQNPHIADNRRQDWDRDRDDHRSWDRDRDNWWSWGRDRDYWDRDYDRNRTRIEFRLSTYPIYIDSRRRTRFDHRSPLYWGPVYRYPYGYYYRDSRLPDRSYNAAPERIIWNDERPQTTQATDEYCREYYTEADVNGRTQQVYGTACMQPDGSWQIKN